MKWEVISEEDTDARRRTERLRVDGGWLYRVEVFGPVSEDMNQRSLALTFVPDRPKPSLTAPMKPRD